MYTQAPNQDFPKVGAEKGDVVWEQDHQLWNVLNKAGAETIHNFGIRTSYYVLNFSYVGYFLIFQHG